MGDIEISVIIPVYNEEENIFPLYSEITEVLQRVGRPYEILFIDDGSTDKTFDKLKEILDSDSCIKIIKLHNNFGQSAAMRAGFDTASGDIIITLDGDLQNDPNDIPLMLKTLEESDVDVVCGWRYNRHDSLSKRIFSKFANIIRKSLTHETVHDSGCTLRVYKSFCIANLELSGELHRYIPALLLWKGYRVTEVKINHRPRSFGVSKYNWVRLIKGLLDLFVVVFWKRYSVRPMHVFGIMGLIIALFGFIIAVYLVFLRIFSGESLINRPTFIIALVMMLIGLQFFALGILADIMMKIYYSQNNRKNYLIEKTFSR